MSVGRLITEAGGGPWAIDKALQVGRPAQISDLDQAFHDAGASTAEADAAFQHALQRFVKRWWDSLSDEQRRLLVDQHPQ